MNQFHEVNLTDHRQTKLFGYIDQKPYFHTIAAIETDLVQYLPSPRALTRKRLHKTGEDWKEGIDKQMSPLDALYMTVITISTVGFREIAPLSPVGKVFTLCLIIGGVGTVIYTLGIIVEFLAEGHLTNTNPSASTVIEAGDKLVVMGTKDQLETLQALI